MHAYQVTILKAKRLCLLPPLLITSIGIVSAVVPAYFITSDTINSGGNIVSSTNYLTHYSLGQLTGGRFSSTNYQMQTNSLSFPDIDGDGILNNVDNCYLVSNMNQINTDGDTLGDICDLDDDNDGLSDIVEASLGTNPLLADTDGDGLNDGVDPNPLVFNGNGDLAPYGAPDGVINIADLVIARQIVLGTITPTAQDIVHLDLYPDGVIDMSDLLLLERVVLQSPL
ncbi:MAG: dockerin type I repeat-containing protein [Gammaproteobacteria bacterium]|nr:dockerin type I repeat-containing protein [Gammaproteobacteria bacterium]